VNFSLSTGFAQSDPYSIDTSSISLPLAHDIELLATPQQLSQFGAGMLAVARSDGRGSTIRFIDLDRSRVLAFGDEDDQVSAPAFSPDGSSLAFVKKQLGIDKVFVSRWDGQLQRQLSATRLTEGNPSWFPDGDRVVFFAEDSNGQRELVSASGFDVPPIALLQLTNLGGRNTTPVVSPDGRYIAFSTDRFFPGWDVCFLESRNSREICPFPRTSNSFCRPHWSPSGDSLVFSMDSVTGIDLFLYSTVTGAVRRVTDLPFNEYDAVFSPDGRSIAFVNNPQGMTRYEVWLLRLSDLAVIRLARSTGSLRYLSWVDNRPYSIAPPDLCPDDPSKLEPGSCGCGFLEPADGSGGVCDTSTQAVQPPSPPEVRFAKVSARIYSVSVKVSSGATSPYRFVRQMGKREFVSRSRGVRVRYRMAKGRRVRFAWQGANTLRSEWTPWMRVGESSRR
jgi:dipeptidyl aminopeptidase/acylaminoacyl peptidase